MQIFGEYGINNALNGEINTVSGRVGAIEEDFLWLGGKENIVSRGDLDALTPADIGAESTITTLPISKGGTGSTTAADALTALGAVAKTGDTMTGKLNLPASTALSAPVNIGTGSAPTSPSNGDIWLVGSNLTWKGTSTDIQEAAALKKANIFTRAQAVQLGVTDVGIGLKITNLGSGESLRIEDESPESTPFVVSASGKVGVGVTPDATVALSVDTTGVKFGDGTIQTTAAGAHASTHATGGTDALTPADIGAATSAQGAKADGAETLLNNLRDPSKELADWTVQRAYALWDDSYESRALQFTGYDQNASVLMRFDYHAPFVAHLSLATTTDVSDVNAKVDNETYYRGLAISNLQTAVDALTPSDIGALGLSESSYIIAKPGDDLAAKYTAAKALTPNGSAKSATNRASLIIFPGNYTLSAELAIDAEFVDLIGLGAQTQNPVVFISGNTLNVSANDVRVAGISVGSWLFKISASKSLQVFENCVGGDYSFGGNLTTSGTFTGCVGGFASFGGFTGGNAAGTFVNCKGAGYSFGGGFASATGIFRGCTSTGTYAFGGRAGSNSQLSGTFESCSGGARSFFTDSVAAVSGATFINCVTDALNSLASVSHRLFSCRLTGGTFGVLVPPYSYTVSGVAFVSLTNLVSKPSHGLSVGDIVWFGGNEPYYVGNGIQPRTKYYVISDGFTLNTFKVSLVSGGAPVTIIANANDGLSYFAVYKVSGTAIMVGCIDGNGDIFEGKV